MQKCIHHVCLSLGQRDLRRNTNNKTVMSALSAITVEIATLCEVKID
jgi:hypothetical protein